MASGSSSDANRPAAIDSQAVLARHGRWLRAVLFARLQDHVAVDEVMQEVALALVRNRAPLEDHSKLEPWLYQLAVRQALMYRRKLGRRRKLVDRYADHCQPTEVDHRADDPLGWLLDDERSALVRQALARMPSREREMLLLKYTEDWTYDQIAAHLGVTRSAVEARLHRARKKMRAELTRLEVIEAT